MCSIFAFIAKADGRPDLSVLATVVRANIARGPHAFGFAWIDGRGRLRSYRQRGRLTDDLPLLRMLADARMLIGHLRFATHGSPADNINNHPHLCDGGWMVHNGVVTNYRDLSRKRGVRLSSACDSEAIAQLVETSAAPTLAGRVHSAVRRSAGPLAVLGLWSRPASMIVARRGNPLHWCAVSEGMYLASLPGGLPGKVRSLVDNQITRLARRGDRIVPTYYALPEPAESGPLFDRYTGGVYRGG